MTDQKLQRPPLGLLPKYIYKENVRDERIKDIHQAIKRFIDAEIIIPREWLIEYLELTQ